MKQLNANKRPPRLMTLGETISLIIVIYIGFHFGIMFVGSYFDWLFPRIQL